MQMMFGLPLLLGNLRGARRLAKASCQMLSDAFRPQTWEATGYSWAVVRRGCWLVTGVMGACTLTYMLSGAILQRALAELILIEGVKPL